MMVVLNNTSFRLCCLFTALWFAMVSGSDDSLVDDDDYKVEERKTPEWIANGGYVSFFFPTTKA
jgi:hypothetical protein